MGSNNAEEYKPYTTPYTGTGAIKTEQGWVSSRDLGAPGAVSGPGNRRDSGPPVPAFHHAELTTSNVKPPPSSDAANNSDKKYEALNARSSPGSPARYYKNTSPSSGNAEETKKPHGNGCLLPKDYKDDHKNNTNQDITSREP